MSKRVLAIVLLLLAIVVPSARAVGGHGDDAGVIVEWNALLQSTLPASAGLQAFRFYAMLHVAMFDAVNAIEDRYEPYRVRVRASHGASAEAAAAQAGRDVLAFLIPGSIATYDAALAARLVRIPHGQAAQGVRIGKKVAEQIVAWRQNDGWTTPPPAYVNPLFPGLWQPTPPPLSPPAFTQFPGTLPFAVLTNTQFLAALPPTLASPQYLADFNEVKAIGKSDSVTRTADQTELARLWAGVITSTNLNAVWNNVARDSVRSQRLSLVEAARVFALMNASMNDGLLTSHSGKFIYGLWRPVTAIRRAAEDLNDETDADPAWLPLLTTPAYPSYPGNMACAGASAATALALAYGTDDIAFTAVWRSNATPPLPDYRREYSGFWQLAEGEANSRVYGGIHFRFDNDASQQVCPKIARFVFDNYMRPNDKGWSR
jgi:hypothetical protein